MKKVFLFSSLLVLSLLSSAQAHLSLSEREPAIVYSLPKTQFCIEVETEKVTRKPGMFYRYSERYLATNKVIKEENKNYRLKNIQIKTIAIPDASRTYSFNPTNIFQTSRLSVNSQGILCGVNVVCEPEVESTSEINIPKKDSSGPAALLPLGEEYMMAGSEAKLAEGTAKQIYRIRESRLSLLTADIDKLPADGESFKLMLEGLNKKECELTELFVGKTTTETEIQKLYLTPTTSSTGQVLFRLSALKGIVTSDDLSGIPYYINIIPSVSKVSTTEQKLNSEKSDLFYILPVQTQVTITDGINTIYSNQFFIPQFGKTLSLPESLFKQTHIKVRIDSQTGRLLSIE